MATAFYIQTESKYMYLCLFSMELYEKFKFVMAMSSHVYGNYRNVSNAHATR